MYSKMKQNVLCLMVCVVGIVFAETSVASIALRQNFDGFTTGPLGTSGKGSVDTIGGLWQSDADLDYPSVDALSSGNPSNLSVCLKEGEGKIIGSSSADPISQDTLFIISFSFCPRDIGDGTQIGSFYMYVDNSAYLSAETTLGIAWQTDTVGHLKIYDGSSSVYRTLDAVNLYLAKDQWVDVKIVVTTWNDGIGYGRYDTWINMGQGWTAVDRNNAFRFTDLHGGVNAILIRPRTPFGEILANFDNIAIASEPLDCQDVLVLNQTENVDLNQDCYIDSKDLDEYASQWLSFNDLSDDQISIIDQNFSTLPLGAIGGSGVGDTTTVDGRWRDIGSAADFPAVVVSPNNDPNDFAPSSPNALKVVRWTSTEGTAVPSIGWTTFASVPQDVAFEFIAYFYPVATGTGGEQGAVTMFLNNYNNVQTDLAIGYYVDKYNKLNVFNNSVWFNTGKSIWAGRWNAIKLSVTTWDNGTGVGLYDVYISYGAGWILAKNNIQFASSKLHDGVNSVYIVPQAPAGGYVYIGDIQLNATVNSCSDLIKLGLGLSADFNSDCKIEFSDFTIFAQEWLTCNNPLDGDCN